MTAKVVSGLRATLSLDTAEPGLLETIGELTVASDRFRTLWGGATSACGRAARPGSTTRWPACLS
jgi:hypothetical protein